MIDFALSPYIGKIDCVDKSAEAIRCLAEMIAARRATNLTARCADARDVRGQWDTVLTVFFGRIDDALDAYLPLCRENLIAVVHGNPQGNLGPEGYHPPKCNTVALTANALTARGVRFTLVEDALEYGQPFTSREEAAAFVRAYSKNPPNMAVDDYLDARLLSTGKEQYPLYLPNLKPFGIFIIGRDQHADL